MTSCTGSRLAWGAFAVVAVCFLAAAGFSYAIAAGGGSMDWGAFLGDASFGVPMLSFAVVGVLVAAREPRNPTGWILLAIGFIWQLSGVAGGYIEYAFVTDPGSLPRPDLVAVLSATLWVPPIGLIGTFLLLLFPNGNLPSRRWRPFAWVCALVMILLCVLVPLMPESLPDIANEYDFIPDVPNPIGITLLSPLEAPLYALPALLPICILGSAASLIRRFRRSRGRERLQLKWLAAGAGVVASIYLIAMTISGVSGAPWIVRANPLWLNLLQGAALYSFVLIPISIGFAILRHRLYDIDVIINRALVYGALSVTLVLIYVAGVVGIGGVIRAIAGQESSDVAVAASTLIVAGLFGPLRRRVQTFIDRRFYRHKYDSERTLADFSSLLRNEVHLDALRGELLEVVQDTMQPAHASVWLRT